MDLTVYLYRVRTTRPQVSTRWFPAFEYVADANEVIEEKVDVVAAERDRCKRAVCDTKDKSGVNADGQSWLMRATRTDFIEAIDAL